MILEPVFAFLSILTIALACALHPHRAQCPIGWYVEGVRPSGSFSCRPKPPGDDHRDARGIVVDDDPSQSDVQWRGDIYCTGGQQPIVYNDRVVGCQLGGWRE